MKIEENIWFDICYKNFDEIREQLKNNEIDPNYEQEGSPLLILIAQTFELDIAEEFIKRGGDVNIRDKYGNTPIIKAVSNYSKKKEKNDSMIRLLLKYGAKIDLENYSNVSARSLANTAMGCLGLNLECLK